MKMILIFFFLSLEAFALETENYSTRDIELTDSSSKTNEDRAEENRLGINEKNSELRFHNCYEVTKKIASRFKL